MARRYSGPVRPGTDVEVFRKTGISKPRVTGGGGGFVGPVRPGTDEEIFRLTGESVPKDTTVKPPPETQAEKDIGKAEKQIEKEIKSHIKRERFRKGISPTAPFGATQPERDIMKAAAFYGKGKSTTPKFETETILEPETITLSTPLTQQQSLLPFQTRGTDYPGMQPPLTRDYGKPPTIYEFLGEEKLSKKISSAGFGVTGMTLPEFSEKVVSPLPKKAERPVAQFLTGAISEPKERPIKTGVTFASFFVLPPVLKGAGVIGKGLGAGRLTSAYPRTTALISKSVTYGTGGLYAGSVGVRTALSPEPAMELGRITGGEALPMLGGLKAGAYAVRRGELAYELSAFKQKLPKGQRLKFERELAEAKRISSIAKPQVQELDLSRLELLEGKPGVQRDIIKFFGEKRGVIVGGSIAQQTQMLGGIKTKRPGDVDVYVKRFLGEERGSIKLAEELGAVLRGRGVEGVSAIGGKIRVKGEKLIEFHPYKSYLRPNIEQVTPFYKPAFLGIKKTPSGVRVLDIGVQYQRKLVGFYLEPFMTGKHRLKDYPAAMGIRESLLKGIGKKPMSIEKSFYGKGDILKPISLKTPKPTDILRGAGKGDFKLPKPSTKDYYSYKPKTTGFYPYRKFPEPTKTIPSIYQPRKQKDIFTFKPPTPSGFKTPTHDYYPFKPTKDILSGKPTPGFPYAPTPKKEKKYPFGFPPIRFGKESKKFPQFFERGFQYTPSVAALGFRGTGFEKYFKAPKIPKGVITGLVLRPIVTKKKKRRK